MDGVEGVHEHLVATRKDSDAESGVDGVGLQSDEPISVTWVEPVELFGRDGCKQLLDRGKERLAGLRHEIDWLRP